MKEPKLRFLADDGSSFPDLKEKCLSDVCEYNKGQSVGINYVGTENMKQDFSGVNDLDSEKEVKGVAYNIGDTLMSNIRPYLKKTWKADVNGVCSTDVLVFHPTGINSDYLYRSISSEKFISYVMTAAKGSKMPRGDKEHIMNYDIKVPCLSEQQKIALLFSELDTLIQSTEKELEGYRELKQCMLQKMFPKKGEKVPEIRFPEFTGDWEQRKLGDTIPVVTDYVAAGSFADIAANVDYKSEPDYAQLVRTVDLKHNFENNDSIYVDKKAFDYLYRVNLDEESIVLPNIGANIGEVYYIEPSALPYERNVLGPNAIYLKPCKNTKFIYSLFQTVDFQKKLMISIASSGQPKFNKTELKEITITLPNNDEQKKIGEYFSNLDNLITLQQKEIDGYKELKKGLLQQMFC